MTNSENNPNILAQFRPPGFPGSYFLSFEGIEGAGKSTQIIKASEYLESRGFRVLVLREPGGTVFGEKLRSAVLSATTKLHPLAEAYLFASSRVQLLNDVVLKELNTPGTIIICDRYIDSSIAYQGVARGLGVGVVLEIHQNFPLNLVPHLTLYLRIDTETSMKRQKMRNAPKDYFEAQGPEFYEQLVLGYDRARDLFPERIRTIDASKDFESVQKEIIATLDGLLLQERQNEDA
jgi:dTMP kinase